MLTIIQCLVKDPYTITLKEPDQQVRLRGISLQIERNLVTAPSGKVDFIVSHNVPVCQCHVNLDVNISVKFDVNV